MHHLAVLLFAAAAEDPVAIANKADVLKSDLAGVEATLVHEVLDTEGKKDRQIYRVLNHIATGNSFIVISSENNSINGMVYLIKSGALYAAPPNKRSFDRLGSLNLDRRISGSLFSHWDLQGNVPVGSEYQPRIAHKDDRVVRLQFERKATSHYARLEGEIDVKTGLFKKISMWDDKGELKSVSFSKAKSMGTGKKRRVPTLVEMERAQGRSDLPVQKTTLKVAEIVFDPNVNYAEEMAESDNNLRRLRAKYVLPRDRYLAILEESEDS